jgi:hypothetical protein
MSTHTACMRTSFQIYMAIHFCAHTYACTGMYTQFDNRGQAAEVRRISASYSKGNAYAYARTYQTFPCMHTCACACIVYIRVCVLKAGRKISRLRKCVLRIVSYVFTFDFIAFSLTVTLHTRQLCAQQSHHASSCRRLLQPHSAAIPVS